MTEQPYRSALAVTPDDDADISTNGVSRALWIGGAAAGDVAVVMQDGSTATFPDVPAGTLLPVAVRRVKATGTTATDILALF